MGRPTVDNSVSGMMAQATVEGRKRSSSSSGKTSTPKKRKKADTFLPSEYFITIKDDARIIVRASKKVKDGVEIKLQVSDKKCDDICDYATWLEAVKLTPVVAMARDHILEHNPPVKSAPTKTTNSITQSPLADGPQTVGDEQYLGSYIDQLDDLEALNRQLDLLN